jgi:hypothetical protein
MVINVNLFIQLNVARKRRLSNDKFYVCHFRHFPNCAYGAECLYIHPPCRFSNACTRVDCPYSHSLSTPASSPSSTNNNSASTGRASSTNRAENSVVSFKSRYRN